MLLIDLDPFAIFSTRLSTDSKVIRIGQPHSSDYETQAKVDKNYRGNYKRLVELKDRHGNAQRRAAFGNTHHVKLYQTAEGKVKADFVTAFEAATRTASTSMVMASFRLLSWEVVLLT